MTEVVDRAAAWSAFERGLSWLLPHADGLSPDMWAAIRCSLLLAEPRGARTARKLLAPRGLRARLAWRLLPNPLRTLSTILESDPLPLAWADGEPLPAPADPSPAEAEGLEPVDELSNLAFFQVSRRRLEEPALSWLRRGDLRGYDLTHQLFAWVLCVKSGYLAAEARERSRALAGRLLGEIEAGPAAPFYDLLAERVAFAALAGAPPERLARWIPRLLAAQDHDGGWWFTWSPADQVHLVENAHLGASPMVHPAASYREQPDPELARRRLDTLHRGHATSLSLWALGFHLRATGRR